MTAAPARDAQGPARPSARVALPLLLPLVLCLLCALVALSGCATIKPHLVAPEVTLTAIRFEGGSLNRQHLQLTAHVYNPNDRAIPVESLSADVELNGMAFATGVTDVPFVLPPQGAEDVVLDVTADMGTGLIALAGRMSHRELPYRVHGEVHLQRGLVRLLHFSHQGNLRF